MKKDLYKLGGITLLLAIVFVGAGYDLFLRNATPSFDETRFINIRPSSSLDEVGIGLVDAGILKKKNRFVWLGKITGWGSQIKAGHFEFREGVSNRDILDVLRRGLQEPLRVRIPAGTRKERLISAMASEMAFSEEDLARALSDDSLARDLSTDTNHLWGFMIPDTYSFYWLTEPEDVIRRVKDHFDSIIASAMDSLDAIPMNMTPEEIIRLAGIVEWESAHVPEKATIAGVYMNRLRNRWALQADPTIQYAIMLTEGEKRRLRFKDYDLDDPFNTYKYRGLPPGPITNPGSTSIQSVLFPEEHRFFYFVAKGDGQHIFSRTLSEHRRNAQSYFRLMDQRRREQAAAESG